MEDLNNGFEPLDSEQNNNISDAVTSDDNIDKNYQESAQEAQKGNEIQAQAAQEECGGGAQADEIQKEADAQKEQAVKAEENYTQKKVYTEPVGADYANPLNEQYSSCYQPPYYVPNFTEAKPYEEAVEKEKKKNKAWRTVAITGAIVIGVMIMAILSVWGMSFMRKMLGGGLDMSSESMEIIKNAPKLEIITSDDPTYIPKSLPEVVAKVGNSVVEIKTSSVVSDIFYGQYVTSGAGSGVIVTQSDAAGYLLTNYHVIESVVGSSSSKASITVILPTGEEYLASAIGYDANLDLAVLRIEKKDNEIFTIANWGSSKALVVGQDVVAIGNPLGSLGGTVTDGIISALDREVTIDGVTMTLLQHNAAINPGNSGGGLFDMMGNLVGIVNAKNSSSQSGTTIEGLGFAIPSDVAFNFFNRVMVIEPAIGIQVKYGHIDRNYGVYVISTSNSDFVKYDKIIKINDKSIATAADYYAAIESFDSGDTLNFVVERTQNGKTVQKTVSVTMK